MKLRETLVAILLLAAVYVLVRMVTGCHALTPAEQAQVAKDGTQLGMCVAEAHLCKVAAKFSDGGLGPCWDEFDACLASHGFADAGAEGGK